MPEEFDAYEEFGFGSPSDNTYIGGQEAFGQDVPMSSPDAQDVFDTLASQAPYGMITTGWGQMSLSELYYFLESPEGQGMLAAMSPSDIAAFADARDYGFGMVFKNIPPINVPGSRNPSAGAPWGYGELGTLAADVRQNILLRYMRGGVSGRGGIGGGAAFPESFASKTSREMTQVFYEHPEWYDSFRGFISDLEAASGESIDWSAKGALPGYDARTGMASIYRQWLATQPEKKQLLKETEFKRAEEYGDLYAEYLRRFGGMTAPRKGILSVGQREATKLGVYPESPYKSFEEWIAEDPFARAAAKERQTYLTQRRRQAEPEISPVTRWLV